MTSRAGPLAHQLVPFRRDAQRAGCTCKWWQEGYIAQFDAACPILDRHKDVPTSHVSTFPGRPPDRIDGQLDLTLDSVLATV